MLGPVLGTSAPGFGAYLDLYLDRVTDFVVLGAMVTGYYLQSGRLGFYLSEPLRPGRLHAPDPPLLPGA
ncbi:MAG: hypothetical protein M0C28_38905 [Candidatus Moduliflexus flocculans]|nr:hypothetical protein [Candidatus Moduliflexus flocculans]